MIWMCGLKKTVVVRQCLHLPVSSLDQFLAAITEVHAPEARHRIQNLVAIGVPDIYAISAADDAAAFLAQFLVIGERVQVMAAIAGLPGIRGFVL
jgi:hypothetical protein